MLQEEIMEFTDKFKKKSILICPSQNFTKALLISMSDLPYTLSAQEGLFVRTGYERAGKMKKPRVKGQLVK